MTQPTQPVKWMVLSTEPPDTAELAALVRDTLFVYTDPGLGGAWTEKHGDIEVVRFGVPGNPESAWFRVMEVPREGHNALTLAIERMIFARELGAIAVLDPQLEAACRRGALSRQPPLRIEVRRTLSRSREAFLAALLPSRDEDSPQ